MNSNEMAQGFTLKYIPIEANPEKLNRLSLIQIPIKTSYCCQNGEEGQCKWQSDPYIFPYYGYTKYHAVLIWCLSSQESNERRLAAGAINH